MKKEDNTEQAILQAAEKEFLDKGFALAKTTDIAQAAGVTHAMLHYYYRTKEKLFERIFQEKVQMLARSLSVTFDCDRPFMQQIEELVGAHFDFIASSPRLPLFILNEIHLNEERRKICLPILWKELRSTLQKVDYMLGKAINEGEVRAIRTTDLVFSFMALNIMTFVVNPIACNFLEDNQTKPELFILQRRSENIEMILSRLRKW